MSIQPWSAAPWPSDGDPNFRDIGADPEKGVRFGFRFFRVHASVSRREVKIAGKLHRSPLRLDDDPANGMLMSPLRWGYTYGPGWNVADCRPTWKHRAGSSPSFPPVSETTHRAPAVLPDGKFHGCGFWLYGSPAHPDADPHRAPFNSYAQTQEMFVHAVCATAGRRCVGTKGFLAERLRIVALAFPIVSREQTTDNSQTAERFGRLLEGRIQENYPDAAVYGSVEAMVAEHPLSPLPAKPDAA